MKRPKEVKHVEGEKDEGNKEGVDEQKSKTRKLQQKMNISSKNASTTAFHTNSCSYNENSFELRSKLIIKMILCGEMTKLKPFLSSLETNVRIISSDFKVKVRV